MEALIEIIFGGIISQFLGLNTRYYFFKIFNKNIKKDDFRGSSSDELKGLGQNFYNVFVGLIVFCSLAIGIAYLFYKLKLL